MTKYINYNKLSLFIGVFFICVIVLLPINHLHAANEVVINLFYSQSCPHCAEEEIFLDQLEARDNNLIVRRFEVTTNRQNAELMRDVAAYLNVSAGAVPMTVIDDKVIIGFLDAETTGQEIERQVELCHAKECIDVLAQIGEAPTESSNRDRTQPVNDQLQGKTVTLPLFGQLDAGETPLFTLTTIIGFLDGFNPCAMWVLLFLISLLLGMQNKWRRWSLGFAFIIASGAVYFLFLSAWLNIFLFIGMVGIVRIIIGLVAIAAGGMNLRAWHLERTGCDTAADEKKRKWFDKIRQVISRKNFLISLVGIVVLAAAVNVVELACSAGLPAVYTQILSLSDLPTWKYYAYLLWYVFVFMLDDLIVFIIAMASLQAFGISKKYSLYTKLIGGIIILLLGLLLIFKPAWLMFG